MTHEHLLGFQPPLSFLDTIIHTHNSTPQLHTAAVGSRQSAVAHTYSHTTRTHTNPSSQHTITHSLNPILSLDTMKETTTATTTTTKTFPSPSNMLLSPELVEIAECLVGLRDRIEGRPREPAWNAVNPFGLLTTWSVKKKRSVPSDSPPPKTTLAPPKAMVQESGLTGEVNGSPATPLGFCFSGGEVSDCKQESNPARARTNNELQQINLNVPQQNDCLRKENLDKKEKASSSSEANLNLAAPSALQQLANPYSTMPRSQASTWYTYQPALIFSATAQFSRFPVAPRPSGIPDLNLSVAEENSKRMIVEDRCQPLHRVQNALHGKMMNQAMAAQARKNRIQIIKLKSFKKLPRLRRTS